MKENGALGEVGDHAEDCGRAVMWISPPTFVTTCCEGSHCAFPPVPRKVNSDGGDAQGTRGDKALACLAKGWKRYRIQQPNTKACIFLAVQFIQS